MKTKQLLLLIICCSFASSFYGQTIPEPVAVKEEVADSVFYTKVDVDASFPGGTAAWRRFLATNLSAMVLVENNAPDGNYTAIISFMVMADGSIADIKCEKSAGYDVCEEGIRIMQLSGKWKPAELNGKKVNVIHRQPITLFKQG